MNTNSLCVCPVSRSLRLKCESEFKKVVFRNRGLPPHNLLSWPVQKSKNVSPISAYFARSAGCNEINGCVQRQNSLQEEGKSEPKQNLNCPFLAFPSFILVLALVDVGICPVRKHHFPSWNNFFPTAMAIKRLQAILVENVAGFLWLIFTN